MSAPDRIAAPDRMAQLLREQSLIGQIDPEGPTNIFACPSCGCQTPANPPHGWGEPCPMRARESEAYVSYYETARMAALRQGVGTQDMVKMLRDILSQINDLDVDDDAA